MRHDLLMRFHCPRPDSSPDDLLVRRATTWGRVVDGNGKGCWVCIEYYRNILWGELQQMAVEDATYVRKVIHLVVEDPLSSDGEIQVMDVWPTFGVN